MLTWPMRKDFLRPDGSLPKLLIIGHGRHGKDSAAALFEKRCGMRFASSSEFCAEKAVFPLMRDLYPDWRACYADRANHRVLWFHAIKAYNQRPGLTLAQQILVDHDIYVGMRSREEFARTYESFDLIVWVDASMRMPLEPEGSMELRADDADVVLNNNGTEQQLDQAVMSLVFGAEVSA